MTEKTKSAPVTQIHWDDSKMQTTFANVVNVQGTQEQVDLYLGTNRSALAAGSDVVTVDLASRVILTPLAAKRLWAVLGGVLQEHENRYGELKID